MKIAIASGKGGTGKTTVAVSLALAANGPVQYLDCDVEEPNGHIFLQPAVQESREIRVTVPRVIEEKCSFCRKCRDICRFKAVTVFGRTIMTFPELCHSCGGCFLVCPDRAIEEAERVIGHLDRGRAGEISFVQGRLRVGEAMAVPLIKAVKKEACEGNLVIVDAPPGTSCPVVATVLDCDYVLLVSEPTPFGFHDLTITVAVLRKLALPFGVIINRADLGDNRLEEWCGRENIPIHLQIPFDRAIAEGYAAGVPLVECRPELKDDLQDILAEALS